MSETVEQPAGERPEARERVQDALAEITTLLRKHRLVEGLVHDQLEHAPVGDHAGRDEVVESLVTRQNKAQLQRKLDRLHPADIAFVLEALPLDERLYIWDLVKADRDGEILLEVSEPVRESLISSMDTEELVAAAETLDAEEIAELAPDLPQEVLDDVFSSLPVEEREQLRAAMSFEDDMVGALMDFEDLQIRPDVTLEVVLRYLRRFDELPSQTDQLFVVDRDEKLLGVLPVGKLIVTEPDRLVADVMKPPVVKLQQHEKAAEAASAFERYDLISAPVVDTNDRLVGRVTVDEVLDFVRERGEEGVLAQAGLREEEDVFASVWKSFQNRWTWLAVNLVTAFIASRVIGVFEGSIEKLVALAALMPIVAGIGGNSGNQTITMIVRAVALGQVTREHAREPHPQGDPGRAGQRARVGRRDGARRDAALPRHRARARDDPRNDAEPRAGGIDGGADPHDDDEARPRSRAGLVGADHGGHRLRRILHLPRPGNGVPDPLTALDSADPREYSFGSSVGRSCGTYNPEGDSMIRKTLPLLAVGLLAFALNATAQMAPAKKGPHGTWVDAKGMTLYTFDKRRRRQEHVQRSLRSQLAAADGGRRCQGVRATGRSSRATTAASSGRTRGSRSTRGARTASRATRPATA